jgi:hypothetical protein
MALGLQELHSFGIIYEDLKARKKRKHLSLNHNFGLVESIRFAVVCLHTCLHTGRQRELCSLH